jgi:hypothetical protein
MDPVMAYVQVDDRFHDSRAVLRLLQEDRGLDALGLHLLAQSWAHQDTRMRGWTDPGHIPFGMADRLVADDASHLTQLLVKHDLWVLHQDDGFYLVGFADSQEVARMRALSEAGRRGGQAKAQRRAESEETPALWPGSSHPRTHITTNNQQTTSKSSPPKSGVAEYSPDFDRFWAVYPRRSDKRAAALALIRALKRAPLENILAGAARYRDDPGRVAKFTKMPATWLNHDCWDDDPLPSRGGDRDDGGTGTGTYAPYQPF